MSIIYDTLSSKSVSYYQLQKNTETVKDTDAPLFNAEVSDTTTTVQNAEAHSGDNNQDQDLDRNTSKENQTLNIKELEKKYKKNPAGIIDELGINFTAAQKEKLKSFLNDKKDLSAVLDLASGTSLKAEDIVEGMEKINDFRGSGFFKRVGNTFKTLFKEGVSEAVQLAKSEKEYYSNKLSGNMDEIRTERQDFSSKGVVDIAQTFIDTPEIKESTMHFVQKEQITGKKLYDEASVVKAAGIMQKRPEDAEEFKQNAVELESIKNENGQIKYNGSTIINVDEKMINNKELQPVMMSTAKKSDMNDEYLIGITDNLVETPEMKDALESFLSCKDKDGKDRFSAENLFNQSSYMKGKDANTIDVYQNHTLDLAKDEKNSSDNIVSSAASKTNNYSQYVNEFRETKEQQAPAQTEAQKLNNVQNSYTQKNATKNKTNPIIQEKIQQNYTFYEKRDVIRQLYPRFGSDTEKIIDLIEKNPSFVAVIKKYNGNSNIMKALLNDPKIVDKFSFLATITNDQLGEILKACGNSTEKTDLMLGLIQEFGVSKALIIFNKNKNGNNYNNISDILQKSTLDKEDKKQKIEYLQEDKILYGVGENREFSA